jgi:hypothetical protein
MKTDLKKSIARSHNDHHSPAHFGTKHQEDERVDSNTNDRPTESGHGPDGKQGLRLDAVEQTDASTQTGIEPEVENIAPQHHSEPEKIAGKDIDLMNYTDL